MVTWHLTIKLFSAKFHERATLRKLWRQTGNSSLLSAKCWPRAAARSSRETLRFLGNKIHCSPRDPSLWVNCYRARFSLNKMSFVIGWFLVTCPWPNSNVSRPGCNCAVVALTSNFATWLLRESLNSVALGDCPRVPPFSDYCKSRDGWCNNHVLSWVDELCIS